MEGVRGNPGGADQALFTVLLSSRPRREQQSPRGALAGSVALHMLAIGGMVSATLQPGPTPAPRVQEDTIFLALYKKAVVPEPGVSTASPLPVEVAFPEAPELTAPELPPPSWNLPVMTPALPSFDSTALTPAQAGAGADLLGLGAATAEQLEAAPVFTPYSVAPELINRVPVWVGLPIAFRAD